MQKMRLYCICLLICLLSGCAKGLPQVAAPAAASTAAPTPVPTQAYWPSGEWRAASPEAQGLDSAVLASMFQQVEQQKLNLHSLLIVRNGYLLTEAYFDPYSQNQPHYIASVTKTVIGTLVGIAIQKGQIKNVDQTLVSFFPDQAMANLDDRKKAITLKDLLTLTAGLKCNDAPFSGEPGMDQSKNWVQFMLDVPMVAQPGTQWNYCGGMVHLLSAVLQKATGSTARDYANRYLFDPLGIAAIPETRWGTDPQGISTGPYGLYLTPRDLAKLGYLYLQDGKWGGQQLLPPGWAKAATTSHAHKDNGLEYGYLWTVDPKQGSFSALGFAGQQLYVVPSKNLVVVFTGALPTTAPDMDFIPIKALMDQYVLPAVKSDAALPSNPAALTRLNELVDQAANPKQTGQPIPDGALQWSGIVYRLDPNPNQWDTISFTMERGGDTATVRVNNEVVDPPVGLDGRFRVQKSAEVLSPEAMRGRWENETTLSGQLIYLGELSDNEFRLVFSADELDMTIKGVVNGQELKMHGKRVVE